MSASPITAPQALENIPTRPTRAEVVAAIRDATQCDTCDAKAFLKWFDKLVKKTRQNGNEYAHVLSYGEWNRFHSILGAIAPDGAVAQPGTAHALVERFLLDPTAGELALLHDRDADDNCVVQMRISTAS